MNDITIVTAFYDLGRADWPGGYSRNTSFYFKCFERLCQLKNKIIVFSENKFKLDFDRIIRCIKPDLIVIYEDIFDNNKELITKIKETQQLLQQEGGLTYARAQLHHPEQCVPEYVLLITLKPYFCCSAIQKISGIDDTVAWIDFGYVRKEEYLPESRLWRYDFRDKIHLWSIKNIPQKINILEVIKNDITYIMSGHIVATREKWFYLKELMDNELEKLLSNSLIDDEQTLLLLSYMANKKEFVLYREIIDYNNLDWFYIFHYYNQA
tara:strand:- start:1 stop:801 length:801 start_codon:yes stop_codon:yes gene_type:complete